MAIEILMTLINKGRFFMKKFILMTMLLASVVVKADWEVVLTGTDKDSEKDFNYPNVMALYDYDDKNMTSIKLLQIMVMVLEKEMS